MWDSLQHYLLTAKPWKQLTCPLMDGQVKKMWHTHTMEYFSATNKKEILPFVTWMKLEGIMLSEISCTEKDKYRMISLICGI